MIIFIILLSGLQTLVGGFWMVGGDVSVDSKHVVNTVFLKKILLNFSCDTMMDFLDKNDDQFASYYQNI